MNLITFSPSNENVRAMLTPVLADVSMKWQENPSGFVKLLRFSVKE
jgi:hypothetical protein